MNKMIIMRKLWSVLFCVLLNVFPMAAQALETVTLETNLGSIQIELLSDDAPKTVENFLNYVNRGDFDGTFFHRRPTPLFVLQGGGFSFDAVSGQAIAVETDPPVVNEFSVSNTRGTIAMAKPGNDPNGATSQWFINIVDNTFLDTSNDGFTVFGRVIGDGMDVVDAIAAIPTTNLGGGGIFADTPTINYAGIVTADTFVTITSASLDTEEPIPAAFTIDTSATAPITGLWWGGEIESGWGMTLTQQTDIMFATIFTYDSEGFPKWYIVSDCAVVGDTCSGEIFSVANGTSILDPWPDVPNLNINGVGNMSVEFTDNSTASMTFDIDGVSSSKQIIRQEFSTLSPGEAMTGLWYNPLESGWGVALTRQSDIAFATMFTYDGNGFPAWFVVSNCAVTSTGCSGDLYAVTGGSSLTEPWVASVSAVLVGNMAFTFSDDDNGTVTVEIDGSSNTKTITRQVFAIDSDSDGVSDLKDNCPEIANADQQDADADGTGDVCEP
jgi:cyclophilin family peptidyl-prolyl cis-trans isomerase